MRPPFDGLTVVSLEQAVAAPFATRQLADLGARVIKLERPGGGDFARGYDRTLVLGDMVGYGAEPNEVIDRAREVLVEHESAERQLTGQLANDESRMAPAAQLTIFTPISQPVLDRLREVDLNKLTPLEALNLLAELKKQI